MMNHKQVSPGVVLAFVLALLVHDRAPRADAVEVSARVVDEAGLAVADASVATPNAVLAVDEDGVFTVPLNSPTTVSLRVSAPGYYTFLHTLHRADFVPGMPAKLPDIQLVRQKPGRSLLVFAGDAMLSRRYFEPRAGEPVLVRKTSVLDDGKKLLAPIRPYVELADFASVNMETQLSAEVLGNPLPKSVTFYSPSELAKLLQWAGFDYVALGNNHLYDFREAGLETTFAALSKTRLLYSGAGMSDDEAREPAHVRIGGTDFGFLSYVGWAGTFAPTQVATADKGGAALGDTAVIAADLAALPEATAAVLQLHAGLEYAESPAVSEQTTLRQAVRDGADLVLGHHPHVLQGFEVVDDRLIAYSLGNFMFDQYHYTTQLGMLLYVWMDGDRFARAEAVPLHVNGYVPTPATGGFRHGVLTRIARLSGPDTCVGPSGLHAVITDCDGRSRTASSIEVPEAAREAPVSVRALGASPLQPVAVAAAEGPYRLGIDLLRRGDFEYARLYGAHDRTWIESRHAALKTGDNNRFDVRVPPGGATVRTGMKVFERVFSRSSPATVSGRIRVAGRAKVRFLLQRRRETDTLEDALASGPLLEIGVWEGTTAGWSTFALDHRQPRVATRSIRLLLEVTDLSDDASGVTVSLDDLAWVEWRTPWIVRGDARDRPRFATHVALRGQSRQ